MSVVDKNEYSCDDCGKKFYFRSLAGEVPTCPFCASGKVRIKVKSEEKEEHIQTVLPTGESVTIDTREEKEEIVYTPIFHKGLELVLGMIFMVVLLFFFALYAPSAFTAIATAALTSVDTGVTTSFGFIFPLIGFLTFLIIVLSVIKHVIDE